MNQKKEDVKDQRSGAVELKKFWISIWDQSGYFESEHRNDTRWFKVL